MTSETPLLSRETPVWKFLDRFRACDEAREWARSYSTLGEAWDACQRADWMIWALRESGIGDRQTWARYACRCVREIWDLLSDTRSRSAVEIAERYLDGQATVAEMRAARYEAWRVRFANASAHASYAVIRPARAAACADAALAAYDATLAASAVSAIDAAADASYVDGAAAAAAAVVGLTLKVSTRRADLVRELFDPFDPRSGVLWNVV